MSIDLPHAAVLAWWGTAWLRGHVVSDLLLDAMADSGSAHTVASATDPYDPGQSTTGYVGPGVLDLLLHLRRAGADHLGLALPVEGDPLGLGGPPAFNLASLEAGQAVVAGQAELGAVPDVVGSGVVWRVQPARRRPLPDVGETDRGLRSAVLETGEALVALDVARWRPELADAMLELHRAPTLDPPPGVPARCADLAARALQCWAIADLAAEDHGAAFTAVEMSRREAALRPLERAARRALVAACSPEVWPEP